MLTQRTSTKIQGYHRQGTTVIISVWLWFLAATQKFWAGCFEDKIIYEKLMYPLSLEGIEEGYITHKCGAPCDVPQSWANQNPGIQG